MNGRKDRRTFAPLSLGPLPVDVINTTLGLELDPGEVVFSIPAQKHALRNHPEHFPACLPHVETVVASPLFMGDDFRNEGKIELVSRIDALGSGLLVAIAITLDDGGNYHVVSVYPVSEAKIYGRLEKRFLRRAIKK